MQIKVTNKTIAKMPNPAIYQDLEYYYILVRDCDNLVIMLNTKTGAIDITESDDIAFDFSELPLLESGQITISW